MYTLANALAANLVGVAAAWWLLSPKTVPTNVAGAVLLVLAVAWMRFVVARHARRVASDFEDLTPHLITHGGFGSPRWDRRSRRQDEPGGAETRAGNSV